MEERNFGIRRDVLKYDDVMNTQREVIYKQRDTVLADGNVRDSIMKMIEESIRDTVAQYTAEEDHLQWNMDGLRSYYAGWLVRDTDLRYTPQQLEDLEQEDLFTLLHDRAMEIYAQKEQKYSADIMREAERVILLTTVDRYWMDHIDNMDELRRGIHLRSIGQHDPVVMYRNEGFEMFEQMVAAIREDTAHAMLTLELRSEEQPQRRQVAKVTGTSGGSDGTDKKQPVRKTAAQKVGRNDPCPCGSGLKYKKCCGRNSGGND